MKDWEKEFDNAFVATGELKSYPVVPKGNWLNNAIPALVRDFISSLLSSQRHALLEQIEGAKRKDNLDVPFVKLTQFEAHRRGFNAGLEEAGKIIKEN